MEQIEINGKFYYLLVLILGALILLPLVSADQSIPPVKLGECANLIQTCANCTFVNITGIHYPSPFSNVSYFNISMSKNVNVYNYSFCNNIILGTYTYDTLGNPDGSTVTQSVSYQVTSTGQLLNSSKAVLYVLILLIGILLFVGCVALGIMLPTSNSSDQMTGYIIAVSNLKYFKMIAWGFAYLLGMLIFYMSYAISYGFLDMDFLGTLFRFAFYCMLIGLLPGFPIFVYFMISNAIRDHKLADMLERGFRVK